jgi:putative sigma-54 modulation protein
MQITVTGQNIDVTDALRDYVSEKLGRIEKHFDRVTNTNVVLQVEKTRQLAEATINARGAQLHANAEGEDMYAAIDSLSDKLDRQVIRLKEKASDHHRSDGAERKHSAV